LKLLTAGFPRTFRLNDPSAFNRVFESATLRRRNGPLRLTAAANTIQTARIGLIVSKRALRHAVDRNRAKRVVRETFRRNRGDLPMMDIVVQVTGPASNQAIRDALLTLFADLRNSRQ
jgi:ribonuclease P protein component